MKTPAIFKNMGNSLNRIGFRLKKSSPEILIVAGIVGTVVSTVMACKATTKVDDIIDEHKEKLDDIREQAEEKKEECSGKDLVGVYASTSVKFVRLYAPSVTLGVMSVGSILMSHKILSKRNVALATAYATIDKSFKEYRTRVADRFGEEVETEIRHNIRTEEVQETVVDEDGVIHVETREAKIFEGMAFSDYSRIFDRTNKLWEQAMDYNLMYLNQVSVSANDRLRANGFLFLNDIYDDLGFDKTVAGQSVGWTYNPKNPNGDNLVVITQHVVDVKNEYGGYDKAIILDFNVDGDILHSAGLENI